MAARSPLRGGSTGCGGRARARASADPMQKRAFFTQQLARHRAGRAAAAADLHLLLLAGRPGALLGLHAASGPGAAATNGSASPTSAACSPTRSTGTRSCAAWSSPPLSTGLAMGDRAGAGAAGRSRASRLPHLPHRAGLALCHRRAGARPRLPLHAGAGGRVPGLRQPASGRASGTRRSTATMR